MFTRTHKVDHIISMFLESDDELLISRSRDGTGHNSHSPHSVVHVESIARGAAAQILKQEIRCTHTTMSQLQLVVVFLVAGTFCKFSGSQNLDSDPSQRASNKNH